MQNLIKKTSNNGIKMEIIMFLGKYKSTLSYVYHDVMH